MNLGRIRLFLISFLILFIEIFLIRWISTEIRIFAYISNLTLLACFLGCGIGCYLSRKKSYTNLSAGMLAFIALALRTELFRNITAGLNAIYSTEVIWGLAFTQKDFGQALVSLSLTLLLFCGIAAVFVPLGQILGRSLDQEKNTVTGYSINVFASLVGVWAFSALSFFRTDPSAWCIVALGGMVFFVSRTLRSYVLFGAFSVLIIYAAGLFDKKNNTVIWSPYQKLEVLPYVSPLVGPHGYGINVNNTAFLTLQDFSEAFFERHAEKVNLEARKFSQYELPFAFCGRNKSVLIIGAGGGNDIAGALRNGAEKVDAVEIDPSIYQLGLELHPEKPYQNARVRAFVNDARAYLRNSRERYDLIIFGLLDSHTLSSNYNNTRLDNYVYTLESIVDAKRLLKDDGILSLTFEAERYWLVARIYGLLQKVFGEVPVVASSRSDNYIFGSGGATFITGNNIPKIKKTVAGNNALSAYIDENAIDIELGDGIKLTTDDWPYLHIETPMIPPLHAIIFSFLLLLFFFLKKTMITGRKGRVDLHFFFLGSAFMLLEFQNVSTAALLFGSTWVVNAYIVSSVLALILTANLFCRCVEVRSEKPYYAMLILSALLVYFVPPGVFNNLGFIAKAVIAPLFLNLPVFFAGILFMHSFENTNEKHIAYGSNILGAAVGGLVESFSFIFGIRAIVVFVLILYVLSAIPLYRKARSVSP